MTIPGEAESGDIDPRLAELIGSFLDARQLRESDCGKFSHLVQGMVGGCPEDLREDLSRFLHSEGIPEEWLDPVLPSGAELTIVTRYKVLEHLSGGGMGNVYIARDTLLGRNVALKVMRRVTQGGWSDDREDRDRFLSEAAITAALAHPSVPAVYGASRNDAAGLTYYAMRLVDEKQTVLAAIHHIHEGNARDRSFDSTDARQLIRYLQGVCEAVHQAHEQGYIHRDLKPSNLALDLGGERVLVLDWGLAKSKEWDPESATDADLAGTLPYMSPEQASGRGPCGPASDVYSLGAIFYHILTNHAPFTHGGGETTPSLLTVEGKILQGSLIPPRKFNRRTPRRLERICRKAMAKDPKGRYASAAELACELRLWLENERPIGVSESILEWGHRVATKRYPDRTLAAAIVLIALIGAFYEASLVRAARADLRTVEAEARVEKGELNAREAKAQAKRDAQIAEVTRLEANRTRAAYDFIDEDFLDARIAYGVNPNITLAQVLDRAVPRIEARFAKDPENEARVKFIVATKYRGIGLFAQAEPLSRRSVDIRLNCYRADDPRTLASQILLAGIIGDAGRLDEAEPLMRENLKRSLKINGKLHVDTSVAMVDLGSLLLERVRKGFFTSYALPLPGLPGSLENAQFVRLEGEELLRNASEIQTAALGPESLRTIGTINNLASSLIEREHYAEAESLLTKAATSCNEGLGEDHPMTIAVENNLESSIINGRGSVDGGKLDQNLETARRVMGRSHPYTRAALGNVLSANLKPGDSKALAKAEVAAHDLWQMQKDEKGRDDPESLALMDQYAKILHLEGNHRAAEPLFRELVDRRRSLKYPAQALGLSLQAHGASLLECGEPADAERQLTEAKSLFNSLSPKIDIYLALCDSALGDCARSAGRFAEAEQLSLTSFPVIQATSGLSLAAKIRALDRIIRLYEDWGKKEQAELWRAKKTEYEK